VVRLEGEELRRVQKYVLLGVAQGALVGMIVRLLVRLSRLYDCSYTGLCFFGLYTCKDVYHM